MSTDSSKKINRIVLEFDTLLDVADRVKKRWIEKQAEEKALSKKIVQIEREVLKLQEVRDSLQTNISTKQQDLRISEKTLKSVELKLSEVKTKLKRANANLRSTEESLQKKGSESNARDKELNSLQGDQEDLMEHLAEEINLLREEHDELASKYWALQFLLREEMLSTPEAKIVSALQGKRSSSIQELQDETYLTRYRVEKAAAQLAERGLLRIESESGTIKIRKPIKIES